MPTTTSPVCDFSDLPAEQCDHCGVPSAADKLASVRTMARELLREHGVAARGWHFEFDSAKRRLGACKYGLKRISLSKDWAEVRTLEESRITLLHEIAHVLAGSHAKHGPAWRHEAIKLGIAPNRCGAVGDAEIEAPIVATCANGHSVGFYRAPKRVSFCSLCPRPVSLKTVFTWTKNGEPLQMSAAYLAELAELKRRGY